MSDDINQAVASVKEKGDKILMEKMEIKEVGWFVKAEDIEGNVFALMQTVG